MQSFGENTGRIILGGLNAMKFKKLDELQKIKRGNVFMHCYFATIFLIIANYLMLAFDFAAVSQQNALLLMLLLIVSLFCIEMICYEIYPITEKRQRILYIVIGLYGIFLLALGFIDILSDEASFIEDHMISNAGVGIILGCLMFSILFAYILKSANGKKER